jgi:hypothetical protein
VLALLGLILNCLTQGANLESLCLGIILAAAGALVSIGLSASHSATVTATGTICRGLASSSIPPSVVLPGPLSAEIIIVLG